MPGIPTAKQLAATYAPSGYKDAWASVVAYSDWRLYHTNHPDAGRTQAAHALDQPPGRIRVWMDGGKPDAVRGLELARKNGWLENDYPDDTFRGLNKLVAWLFAGGNLTNDDNSWFPRWSLDRNEHDELFDAAATQANVDYTINNRPGQGREATPTEYGNILGRVFAAMGVPRGARTDVAVTLPDYLDDAPREVRREFARVYLLNAGSVVSEKELLVLNTGSAMAHADEFAALLNDVVGDGAGVSPAGSSVSIPFEVVGAVAPERLGSRA